MDILARKKIETDSLRVQPSLLFRSPDGGFVSPQRQKIQTDDVNQCLHN